MRILMINSVCGLGSTGKIVTELKNQAKEQGHIVKIACSTVEPIRDVDREDIIVVGSKQNQLFHNALSRITDGEGLYSKRVTINFVRQIEKFNPDIVHLHNLHGHWINYEILFSYLAEHKKKVVWTLHDCWAFTGHCAHFSALGCEQWKTHCSDCTGLRGYPICYGKGNVSSNFDRKKKAFTAIENMTIVTPSEWLADVVRSSFLGIYNVKAINNGVDLNVFKPTESNFRKEYSLENKKIVLGVANVWIKKKGYDDILSLSEMLDDQYKIVLVGLTRDQIEKLPKKIVGIERTESVKRLVEIYSAADVFINPSYEETMGLVTAEALACGTPAVVYDKTAVPEVVDNLSGVVVEAGNIEMLCREIKNVINNRNKYGGARERAFIFEKEKQYGKYLALYNSI